MAEVPVDDGGTAVWRRRLDVRVRRVSGQLALKGPAGAIGVPKGSTWLWTALDGRSTLAELCERAGVAVEDATTTFQRMVDAGVVEPASSPEGRSGDA
jgi:hypothetical protein